MRIRKDRLFLVLLVLCTVAYLVIMTIKVTGSSAVEAAVMDSTVSTPVVTVHTEQLIANTNTSSIAVETPVAGISLVLNNTAIETVHKDKEDNKDDLYLLAKLIHCEAGIDNNAGKLAVGTVVMNRANNSNHKLYGGPTIKGVIYHKLGNDTHHQFSCVDDKQLWSEEPTNEDIAAAQQVLDGYRVFNSTYVYYYNPSICDGISGIECDYRVGKHVFGHE